MRETRRETPFHIISTHFISYQKTRRETRETHIQTRETHIQTRETHIQTRETHIQTRETHNTTSLPSFHGYFTNIVIEPQKR